MYLLDTNVISESRRRTQYNAQIFTWLESIESKNLYTNAIVMMELERGILSKERKDVLQGKVLRIWFEETVKPAFDGKILPISAKTAQICAKLHIPDFTPENDAWIASSALEHHLILVTRNTQDFARTGVKLLNPFEYEA